MIENPLFWLELLCWLGLVGILVTQLIIPLAQGRPVFPWVRSNERRLAAERARLHQEEHEQALLDEIDDLKTRLAEHERERKEPHHPHEP